MAVKMVFVLIVGYALISTVLNLMSQKHGKYLQRMMEHFDDADDAAFQAAFDRMMAEDNDAIFLEKGKLLKKLRKCTRTAEYESLVEEIALRIWLAVTFRCTLTFQFWDSVPRAPSTATASCAVPFSVLPPE